MEIVLGRFLRTTGANHPVFLALTRINTQYDEFDVARRMQMQIEKKVVRLLKFRICRGIGTDLPDLGHHLGFILAHLLKSALHQSNAAMPLRFAEESAQNAGTLIGA